MGSDVPSDPKDPNDNNKMPPPVWNENILDFTSLKALSDSEKDELVSD
jgi:hypothetical protein